MGERKFIEVTSIVRWVIGWAAFAWFLSISWNLVDLAVRLRAEAWVRAGMAGCGLVLSIVMCVFSFRIWRTFDRRQAVAYKVADHG